MKKQSVFVYFYVFADLFHSTHRQSLYTSNFDIFYQHVLKCFHFHVMCSMGALRATQMAYGFSWQQHTTAESIWRFTTHVNCHAEVPRVKDKFTNFDGIISTFEFLSVFVLDYEAKVEVLLYCGNTEYSNMTLLQYAGWVISRPTATFNDTTCWLTPICYIGNVIYEDTNVPLHNQYE